MPNTGRRIKALRLERQWSLADLAKQSGVSKPFLSLVETNARTPSLDTLQKIADAFNVDVSLLVGVQTVPELKDEALANAFFRAQNLDDDVKEQLLEFLDFYIKKETLKKKSKNDE
jgi:transcriptional regulator with XRE-family HTH domain